MDCSTPGFPVLHRLLEFAQTHVCWVGDAIQQSHPLSSPSPPALNLSQYQSLSQWAGSLHQMAKVLELQLQQSFQWIFRVDFCLKRPYLIDTVNSLTPTPQPAARQCNMKEAHVTHVTSPWRTDSSSAVILAKSPRKSTKMTKSGTK